MPISDDLRRLELAQIDMTAGLFAVLDNILSSIIPPPPVEIKAGGYPEEIFVTLNEEDKQTFECSICYMVLKEAQQCKNKHKFCTSCIMAWTLHSTSHGADKCPVCRCEGNYVPCDILNARLSYKRVKCQKEECDWSGFLKDFESHEHNTYDAPLNIGPKRSLPAVPGTSRSSSIGSTTGSTPAAVLRSSSNQGPANANEVTRTPHPPARSQAAPSNAQRRSSNASTTSQGENQGDSSTRTNARPTPRAVRQANRLTGNNPSNNTTTRRNSMPATSGNPPNTVARRNSNPASNPSTRRNSNVALSGTNRSTNPNHQSGSTPSSNTTRRPSVASSQANRNPQSTTQQPNSVVRSSQESLPRTTQSPRVNQDAGSGVAATGRVSGVSTTSTTEAVTTSQEPSGPTQDSGSQDVRANSTTQATIGQASRSGPTATESTNSPRQAAGTQTQSNTTNTGTTTSVPRPTTGGQTSLLNRRRSSTPNRLVLPQRTTSDNARSSTTTVANSRTSVVASSGNAGSSIASGGNDSEDVPPNHRPTQLPPINAATMGNNGQRVYRQNQFRAMASQIREGRSQLQDIMMILNGELETRRQSITNYQQFQERQHHERLRQLQEVHTLGRRLGEVASNLAVLVDGIRGANTRRRNQNNDGNDNNHSGSS